MKRMLALMVTLATMIVPGGMWLGGDTPGSSGSSPRASRSLDAANAPRPLRVLVADDDRDTVLTLTLLLRDEGYETHSASGGRQALSAIGDFDPDVVLLDIALPELSGWEVARMVRKRHGESRPVLIGISGEYKLGADRILSEILGFDYYLVKPCDPRALLRLLASLASPDALN
jgi:CheY-like chemotaxis protein